MESAAPSRSERPDLAWSPNQIFGISFLFGPVAGGVVAAINFRRIGQPQSAGACIALGVGAFAAFVVAAFLGGLSGQTLQLVGLVASVGSGALFQAMQREPFEAWKNAHWRPIDPDARYRGNRLGLLFLAGLGCLAAEFGIIMLASALQGAPHP